MIYVINGDTYSSVTSGGTIEWITNKAYYYGPNGLKSIDEGLTGKESAELILNNDNILRLKIESLKQQIEAYKEYVEKLKHVTKVKLKLANEKGDGKNIVMSQSAITYEINDLQKQIDDSVFTKVRVPESNVVLNVKELNYAPTSEKVDKSAQELEGHVLSTMWHDVDDLKQILNTLETTINAFKKWKEEIFG